MKTRRMQKKFKIFLVILLAFFVLTLLYRTIHHISSYSTNKVSATKTHGETTSGLGVSSTPETCNTVHVAFVVAGTSAVRSFMVVLKSMLYHRHSPMHIHFISDDIATSILRRLLHTWSLPRVNYTFYSTESIRPLISWIPNAHYSGLFGLMKLTLPFVLLNVDKVIVMDIDVTIASDVTDLWKLFEEILEQQKLIGLVENQSDWYLGTLWKDHNPWPAIGRGFNTGVMLMDLNAMRQRGWMEEWRNVTKETLPSQKYTSLADQDIINTLVKRHPSIVYRIPCMWNMQLSDHSLSTGCLMEQNQYKIVHWNSPKKLNTDFKNTPFFRELHYSFMQYNGAHLVHSLIYCKADMMENDDSKPVDNQFEECEGSNAKRPFRTHLYFYGLPATSTTSSEADDEYDVTLISQLSMDRLHMLKGILLYWKGPISLALYATDADSWKFLEYVESLDTAWKEWNLRVHLVYKEDGRLYPVNYLRNIALNMSTTPFVFLSDFDFIPAPNLHLYLKEAVKVLKVKTMKRALVVPAFESLEYKLSFPEDKETLLNPINKGKIRPFRQDVWEQGHLATDYDKWYQADHPYKVSWAVDYEPYVVVSRNVSRYDERFTGFGWNKVSHTITLDAEGYEFVVLPHAFMIHLPHSPSMEIISYRSNQQYRNCQRKLKEEFVTELIKEHGPVAEKYSTTN